MTPQFRITIIFFTLVVGTFLLAAKSQSSSLHPHFSQMPALSFMNECGFYYHIGIWKTPIDNGTFTMIEQRGDSYRLVSKASKISNEAVAEAGGNAAYMQLHIDAWNDYLASVLPCNKFPLWHQYTTDNVFFDGERLVF